VIEIEVMRKRGDTPSILRVRDFADGMDAETMQNKLSRLGDRVSGMDKGELVRGTHSRGAKDVAALGRVVFESIAGDALYHKCEITPFLEFVPPESCKATPTLRKRMGIPGGTGTVVTIELDSTNRIPQHENLKDHLSRLVSLRGILKDERRKVYLRDLGQDRRDLLEVPKVDGTNRLKEAFEVPGYPGARAKLMISRAKERFDQVPSRFRLGGILIESKRAIHEATLFDSSLESNPHAMWFYGRLVCPYIDDLSNEFDDLFEAKRPPGQRNPMPPLDPSRRSGLNRDHPFTKSLFGEALKRLRPLVEEERIREERQRVSIESRATRKRLQALEKAAMEFLRNYEREEETSRDPRGATPESEFRERGYALSPPYAQMVIGHSQQFWLNMHHDTFPEIEVGASVQVATLSAEVIPSRRFCALQPHPVREGVLSATWKVKAVGATPATGLTARVGPIKAESLIEVIATEADKYAHVKELCFDHKRYRIRTNQKKKRVLILAPLQLIARPTPVDISVDSNHFRVSGAPIIKPVVRVGAGIGEIFVKSDGRETKATITCSLGHARATAEIMSIAPVGANLSIKLEDVDLGNQRYRWRQNILEIAARHASLKRYLGDKIQRFPGQESKHFRVLIAEVVSDAVCALLVRRNVQGSPEEFEDADWDQYYAMYSQYMTKFLPVAHGLQCPEDG